MKKLIQIIIVCVLVVVMGGVASGDARSECDIETLFRTDGKGENFRDKKLQRIIRGINKGDVGIEVLYNLAKKGNGEASYLSGVFQLVLKYEVEEAMKFFKLSQEQNFLTGYDEILSCLKIMEFDPETETQVSVELEKIVAKEEQEKEAAEKAKTKLIMQEAEKYRDVVKKSCEKEEKVSQCITTSSCIVASIIEELKHDDRGKKFKKTVKGGLLSKGSFDKAFDELKKSADKDELLKNQVMKISMSCIFQ
jgi:hypothetical protein